MALTSVQRTTYELLGGLVLVVGGFLWFLEHERHVGAIDQLTKQTATTVKAQQDTTAQAQAKALSAAQAAEHAKQAAFAQVRASEAARRAADSSMRVATDERRTALRALGDSATTRDSLRANLGRLIEQSRADSVAHAVQLAASTRAMAGLLTTITTDSLALAAARDAYAALARLNASTAKEVKLLRSAAPSAFGNVLRYGLVALAAVEAGRLSAGKF